MKIQNIDKTGFFGTFKYKDENERNRVLGKLGFTERFFTEQCLDRFELSIINDTPDDKEYGISLGIKKKVQYLNSYKNEEVYLRKEYLTVEVSDISGDEAENFEEEALIDLSEDSFILNKVKNVWELHSGNETFNVPLKENIQNAFKLIMEKITASLKPKED